MASTEAAEQGERLPHVRIPREIDEIFVGGEAKPDGGAVYDRVHRIGIGAAPCRHDGDQGDLDEFFGNGDRQQRMKGHRGPVGAGTGGKGCERRAHGGDQKHARSAEQECGPDAQRRRGGFICRDHQPQH